MMEFVRVDHAVNLPDFWDEAADHYCQRRAFLDHCETWNPCRQSYRLAMREGRLVAGAVQYELRLSLLTFAKIDLPVTMSIVGVPCSVSHAGLIGPPAEAGALLDHLRQKNKGFLLALNLGARSLVPDEFTAARTLPTVVIEPVCRTWDGYLDSMRSDYRRRVRRILAGSDRLTIRAVSCQGFSRQHHDLYLQVWGRSDAKLEKLSLDFFRHLPGDFRMITIDLDGRLVGWAIVLESAAGLDFFLGGIDYEHNLEQTVYRRLLVEIVRRGIESGAARIDLGQTAEVPKMRLGGVCLPRHMGFTHGNPILSFLLDGASGFLEYRRQVPTPHVFGGQP
jgi:hypothetical protein